MALVRANPSGGSLPWASPTMTRGAIADGTSHPLSTRYGSLGAAQAVYPHVTSLSQEIDWAALQGAINDAPTSGAYGATILISGRYWLGGDTIISTRPGIRLFGLGGQFYGASSGTSPAMITSTSTTAPVFTIGTTSATEHRGWVVENITVVDGNTNGGNPGAFRLNRVNFSRFYNVNVDNFQTGYGWLFDGTGDTCQYTELIACRGRKLFKAVTYAFKADDTVILGGSFFGTNAAGSIGFELGSSMRAIGSNVQGFDTHVTMAGNNCAISNTRHDSSAGTPSINVDVLAGANDVKIDFPSFGGTYPSVAHMRINSGAARTCIAYPSTNGGAGAVTLDSGTETSLVSWKEGLILKGDGKLARAAGGTLQAAAGLATKIKAGSISDADFSAAPPDGTLGVDTTSNNLAFRSGGTWRAVGVAAGGVYTRTTQTSVTNTTTETVLDTYTIAAGSAGVGTAYRITASGQTDTVGTSGTLIMRARIGGVTGVILGQITLPSQGAATLRAWSLVSEVAFRVTGGAGRVAAFLSFTGWGTTTAAIMTNSQAPGSSVGTTAAQDLVLTAQWATADAGNVLREETCVIELVKP